MLDCSAGHDRMKAALALSVKQLNDQLTYCHNAQAPHLRGLSFVDRAENEPDPISLRLSDAS
jgi:hypothetical protein